jgi:hypothetical protein
MHVAHSQTPFEKMEVIKDKNFIITKKYPMPPGILSLQ